MKKLNFGLLFVLSVVFLTGCNQQKTRDYIGTYGEYRIAVPNSWEQVDEINEKADLCLGDKDKSRFLVIQYEKKAEFGPQFLADDYFEHAKESILASHDDCEIVTTDLYALQFTAKAMKDGVQVHFFVSVKESDDKFWQLVFWTASEDFDEAKSIFIEASDSFNATDGISLNVLAYMHQTRNMKDFGEKNAKFFANHKHVA